MRTEPKFIVCLSQLMLLFQVCPLCRSPNPLVDVQRCGTMAKVLTTCHNQGCGSNVWDSQPNMVGTKIPAGNFLLSFAILVAGGSPSKTLRIFEHMGLSCIALSTYFRHQSVSYTVYFLFDNYLTVYLLMQLVISDTR